MIDAWLAIGALVGGVLALSVERGRRARLQARIGRELDALGNPVFADYGCPF